MMSFAAVRFPSQSASYRSTTAGTSSAKEEPKKTPEDPSSSLYVQPKLTVGSPDDFYEKEADSMADRVMRMSDAGFVHRNARDARRKKRTFTGSR